MVNHWRISNIFEEYPTIEYFIIYYNCIISIFFFYWIVLFYRRWPIEIIRWAK